MKKSVRAVVACAALALFALPASAQADVTTFSAQPPALSSSTSAHFEFSYPSAMGYLCSLDGAAAVTCASPYDLAGLADGAHSLTVTANYTEIVNTCIPMPPGPDMCFPMPTFKVADPASVSFTVDTVPPPIDILAGPGDRSARKSTNATFVFSSDAGVAFTCSLDGKAISPCTSPLALKKLAVGIHKLSIGATDAAGNVSNPLVRVFAINSKKTTYKFTGTNKVKRCTKKKSSKKKVCKTKTY